MKRDGPHTTCSQILVVFLSWVPYGRCVKQVVAPVCFPGFFSCFFRVVIVTAASILIPGVGNNVCI